MALRVLKDVSPAEKAKSLTTAWACELCGAVIPPDRAARAISRGHLPRFCRSVAEHLSRRAPGSVS